MAENVGNLNYKLGVNTEQFTSGFNGASRQIEQFANESRRQSAQIEASFASLAQSGPQLLNAFRFGGISGGLEVLQGGLGGIGTAITSTLGLVGTFSAGMVAGLAAIGYQAQQTSDELNKINKFARTIGESGFNAQVLAKVFERQGFSQDDARQTLSRLFNQIGELRQNPNSEFGQQLERIGLDPRRIATAEGGQAIEEMAVALSNLTNEFDRNRSARAIFGKEFSQLSGLVRLGRRQFDEARLLVRASGAGPDALAAAAESTSISRSLSRQNELGFNGSIRRGWDDTMSGVGLAIARGRRNIDGFFRDDLFGGFLEWRGIMRVRSRQTDRGPSDIRPEFAITADAAQRRREIEASTASATELANQWRRTAETSGLTTRQIEIQKAEQAGVTAAILDQLRLRDRELTIIEDRNRREQQFRGILDANRTAGERFRATMEQLNLSSFRGIDQTRLLAATFRDLERSLGGGGGSFAINAIDPRTIEGARFTADIETRRRNGVDDPNNRVVAVLEAIRQIDEETARDTAAIAEALRNQPNLFVAGVR